MKSSLNYSYKDWYFESTKGHILPSQGDLRDKFEREISLPNLPEMLFADNTLTISHKCGFSLKFNAFDALKLVDPQADLIKVSVAKEWRESRSDCEFIDKMIRPFDWTFTTNYKGSIIEKDLDKSRISQISTDERINMEKLKIQETILFFDEVCLFEDELSDHGTANLSVKIRLMPSGFYILQRFFLRVDGVVVRLYDTRIHHELDKTYMIREYSEKESLVSDIQCHPRLLVKPNELAPFLKDKSLIIDRIDFKDYVN